MFECGPSAEAPIGSMYIKSQLNLGKYTRKITSNWMALGGPKGMVYLPIHEWLIFMARDFVELCIFSGVK